MYPDNYETLQESIARDLRERSERWKAMAVTMADAEQAPQSSEPVLNLTEEDRKFLKDLQISV